MPKANGAKTKSEPKRWRLLGWAVFIAAAIVVATISFAYARHNAMQPKLVTNNGHTYTLLVAQTEAEQSKGLGGRQSLPRNQAMIFVFPNEATRCFWMKDMRFPLDMVWTNASRQVVAVEQNVSPKTYPKAFCPAAPAEYVIELNAGQARAAGIHIGEQLTF